MALWPWHYHTFCVTRAREHAHTHTHTHTHTHSCAVLLTFCSHPQSLTTLWPPPIDHPHKRVESYGTEEDWCHWCSLSLRRSLTLSLGVNNKYVHECFSEENAPLSEVCQNPREREDTSWREERGKLEERGASHQRLFTHPHVLTFLPGTLRLKLESCPTELWKIYLGKVKHV